MRRLNQVFITYLVRDQAECFLEAIGQNVQLCGNSDGAFPVSPAGARGSDTWFTGLG